MKKILMAMAAALMLAACGNGDGELVADVTPADTMKTAKITFTFGSYSQQSMTRATLSDAQMTDLWMFDYMNDELVQTIHQTSDADGFGAVSINADYGEHHFCFVASRGTDPTVDGTVISWARPSDTFWTTSSLNIQPNTSGNQQISLQRVATRLRISVTDEVPATLSKLAVTPSAWYYGLDYLTGEATTEQTTERTVSIPESYIGTTGNLTMSIYGLSPATEWQTDVTVTAKASDETQIASVTIPSVPFTRNRITSYTGSLFGQTRAFTISVDSEWLDDYEATW